MSTVEGAWLAPPVDVSTNAASQTGYFNNPDRAARWAWGFVALGVIVRLWRFLRRYPLWLDEHLLAVNLLDRDYLGLTGGLERNQAAPVGFLWIEKLLVDLLGFNEFTLRASAVVASIAGLLVFRVFAGRILQGFPLVAAVGLLACSYFPIRHAAEFKPYAGDLLFSVCLLMLARSWFTAPLNIKHWLALTVTAVVALPFSYPAVFVATGIGLAMLPMVVRLRRLAVWCAWIGYNAAVVAVFAGLYWLSVRNQFSSATNDGEVIGYWTGGFPPTGFDPRGWLAWLVASHTGEALAYPLGGKNFGSILQFALAVVGIGLLWRRGERRLLWVTACVMTAALGAAVLQRYPYGQGERLQQYWAPWVCLFIAVGLAAAIERIRNVKLQSGARWAVVAAFLGLCAASIVGSIFTPYKHRWDRDHQAFARWFWKNAGQTEPLVCITSDLGYRFYPDYQETPYRTNQAVYRPRIPIAPGVDGVSSIPPGTAVRCVAYSLTDQPQSDSDFGQWMQAMQRAFRLTDERKYQVMIDDKPGKSVTYHVWRFEPLDAGRRLSEVLHR